MKNNITSKVVYRSVFMLSIIIFIVIQIFIYKFHENIKLSTEVGVEILNTKSIQNENNLYNEEVQNNIWQIQIPKIELTADIDNGTDKETLNKYVGHFKETPIENGNIGLAAHNRGYNVNYFSRLKELTQGDEIIYIHNGMERTYEVTKNKIIKDTDVDILENTEENIITLITCVENEPNYRRCVQAEEKDFNYNY